MVLRLDPVEDTSPAPRRGRAGDGGLRGLRGTLIALWTWRATVD
ncbi:MAG: hypothetical protein ACYSWU_14485 [Planctomycetota bacterium]